MLYTSNGELGGSGPGKAKIDVPDGLRREGAGRQCGGLSINPPVLGPRSPGINRVSKDVMLS